ncbi:MAG: GNAT family N-acetyltransferase [Methanosarcinales archaeon]|nr:GNAT family N-acetyltransferase [Methanosarcinales archaeon]
MRLNNRDFDRPVTIRHDLRPGDVGYITYLHGSIYGREQGWDHTFDAYVAVPLSSFAMSHTPREQIWIVEQEGRIVGSAAVVQFSEDEAQLRWLLLDPGHRGCGLGRHLVKEAVQFCRAAGYSSVFLWTVDILAAATGLYQSLGFVKTEEVTHRLWGSMITEVSYQLSLSDGQTGD